MEMGFPEDVCVEALERYDGDEQLALNFLLGGWEGTAIFVAKVIAATNEPSFKLEVGELGARAD